jgi:DNA invertase Pin-like site-specific DNA recombinase
LYFIALAAMMTLEAKTMAHRKTTTKGRSKGTRIRAAIYARVSTREQSPQMQLDVLKEYAEQRGFDVVGEYVDHGVSGARERRPALDQLMDATRKRKVEVVLVYKFDRFARSVKHLITALDEFQGNGVQFVSYSENIDTGSALGRAFFSICAALSEMERSLIVERSAEGQRRARARGKHIGRPRKQVSERRVVQLRDKGLSLRAIARHEGVSTSVIRRVLRESKAA